MLLALDIGNTSTEIGLFHFRQKQGENPFIQLRISTPLKASVDEYGSLFRSLLFHNEINYKEIQAVICSSVVPAINIVLEEMLKKYFGCTPLCVKHHLTLDMEFDYPKVEEIGADRIVNAVAVKELYSYPAIILDFGTATTFCVLSEKGKYMGGVIAPGLSTSLEALTLKAAKLPGIELSKPDAILGSSTIKAMRSGVYWGAVYSLEGIVKGLKEEMNIPSAKVVATGGFASHIAESTKSIDILDQQLTLKGLHILYLKNVN